MASTSAPASGAPSTVVPGQEEAYVKLDLKLINFSFLPIILRVRTSTPLFMVKRHLVERHGRLAELHIYRGAVSAENELSDGSFAAHTAHASAPSCISTSLRCCACGMLACR
ncbi:hypothetical protein EON66_03115 [archaeon]|nr:MAG: hypothetical protein EON66_03115 [archaeon]